MSALGRLAERLLQRLLPSEDREAILGDLAEEYHRRRARGGARADMWYWGQVVAVPFWLALDGIGSLRLDGPEIRRTVRGLLKNPGFAALAVVSLGVGIGATTSIAGALHSLLYLSLPVERPEEISLVYHSRPEQWEGGQFGSDEAIDPMDGRRLASNVSYPAFSVLQPLAGDVELAGYAFVRELAVVAGDSPARAASGMLVSDNYFDALRLSMRIGRPLTRGDGEPGAPPVVVLSHTFWQRVFASDPSVVGRITRVNGEDFEIVGVTQEGYVGLSPGGFFGPSDVILPLSAHRVVIPRLSARGEIPEYHALSHWIRLIARTPRGVDGDGVRRDLTAALAAHMVESGVVAAADAGQVELRFLDGRRGLDSLRRDTRGPLRILTVVVALVLLIACANLATLLLARSAARAPDHALRRAIGASRWELIRPQVVESAVIAGTGTVLGVLIAQQSGPLLVAALTRGAGNASVQYQLDGVLLTAACASGLLAAIASGVLPVIRTLRTDPARRLGGGGRSRSGGRFPLGRALIVAQIAVSVPLVVGAALFLRTLGNLTAIDPGFEVDGLAAFRVDAALVTQDQQEQSAMYARILADLRSASVIQSASVVENVLVSGWQSNGNVQVDGVDHMMDMNAVSPGFLEAMRIDLVSGRSLQESDDQEAPAVAMVNQTAERVIFGGRALGRTIEDGDRRMEIVGVVRDTKYSSLRAEVDPTFFDPYVQRPGGLYSVHYVVRSDRPIAAVEAAVREVVARVDLGLPVTAFRSQGDQIESAAQRERVFARLLSLFGGFALVLSCIGLHGVTSFTVARRTSEMGVRLALGAAPLGIVRLVLRQVVGVTLVGLAIGVPVAYLLSPVVGSMLFGLEPTDLRVLAAAAAVMAVVAVVAGWLPARRASRVDPAIALSADAR